ncbi:MAG: lipid-A-disaccharide synthase [Aquificae bacterium]|nr:lipid-A-disaccharide synthase [Aquificota bacterium]
MKKLLISLADRSASNYVSAIFSEGFEDFDIYALTDEKLSKLPIHSVASYTDISSVGITEALTKLPKALQVYRKLLKELKNTDTLILCDAPALNLRLLKDARKLGVKKIIYFIPPQVWAWKPGRARVIGELADHVIVILPFERKLFKPFRARVHYLGHPLVDLVKPKTKKEEFLKRFKKTPIGVLPGSRKTELKKHLPLLSRALSRLVELEPVVPTFPELARGIEDHLRAHILTYEGASYDVFYHTPRSLIASGSASLEAGLANHPHVVFYRVSGLTYFIGKKLVKVPHVSLVNILLSERVVPELLQPKPDDLLRALEDVTRREGEIKEKLSRLRTLLGQGGVITSLRALFREII